MARTKQRSNLDWELTHVITSLPLDIERLTGILEAGADVNTTIMDTGKDLSVLRYACLYGHTEAVQLLLDHGAEMNARNESGVTPLYVACECGHTELVEALLERGTDVNVRDNFVEAPLHVAGKTGRRNIMKLLLDHGADPSVLDHGGWTPMRHAMDLDGDSSCREESLDLFREYAPEQYFTAFCETPAPGRR